MFENIEIVEVCYRGARAGDDKGYELYVNNKQWKFPCGATRGRTEGEILKDFLKTMSENFSERRVIE